MKKRIAELLVKYPFLKWITNRFVLATLFLLYGCCFLTPTLFTITELLIKK